MLVEGFYNIESIEEGEGEVIGHITLNPNHELFKGHFPEQPVVPGVMQLQIIKEILEEVQNRRLTIRKIKQIKYLTPIIPTQFPRLSFEMRIKNTLIIGFKVIHGEMIFSKGNLEME